MNKDSLLIPENYEYKKLQRSVGACNCCGAEGETEVHISHSIDDIRGHILFVASVN